MLRWFAIQGESLEPDYRAGDFALAARLPGWWKRLRPGDVILFRHAVYGLMVKRIDRFDLLRTEVYVIGSHPASIDSRTFGPLKPVQILGKVIWHVRKPQKDNKS